MDTNNKPIEELTFNEAVAEYALDPNCAPELWISDKGFKHWSKQSKDLFIQVCFLLKRNIKVN
jgi:hypothetical protein